MPEAIEKIKYNVEKLRRCASQQHGLTAEYEAMEANIVLNKIEKVLLTIQSLRLELESLPDELQPPALVDLQKALEAVGYF